MPQDSETIEVTGPSVTGGGDTSLEQILLKMNADNQKFRQADKKVQSESLKVLTDAHTESLRVLSDKLEALQLNQLKSLEAQRTSIKTPLPKYSGKAGEFDDWKSGVLNCIKMNDWTDEKRILEMLPGSLTGQAIRAFNSLPNNQKTSLETVFAALKESLDPACKTLNREMFIKAKRNPGESMRAFVSRCNQYVMRADEIDNVEDSPWAKPFIVEKIYANLNPWDRKILRGGVGKSVQLLCEKADELLALNEDVVGSIHCEIAEGPWHSQLPPVLNEPQWQNQQVFDQEGQNYPGPSWGWQNQRGQNFCMNQSQRFRPGGESASSVRSNNHQEQKVSEHQSEPEALADPLN